MDYHRAVCIIFDHFHYKLYENAGFNLDLSINKQDKQVDNFVKLLGKTYKGGLASIGSNFLIDYFCFAFDYWSDKKVKRKISLGWIIGKKTFKRWVEKSDGYQHFYSKFLYQYDINIEQIRQQLAELEFESGTIAAGLDPAEEIEKQRFFGDAALYNCMMNTTMYNHKSPTCMLCTSKSMCKKYLKLKNPQLYKKRGYLNETGA